MANNEDWVYSDRFRVDFSKRRKDTAWSLRREPRLRALGCSEPEILQLKFNRMSNPRVRRLLGEVQRHVRKIQRREGFATYEEAAEYRRDYWVSMVDAGEIEESPYRRMGYE